MTTVSSTAYPSWAVAVVAVVLLAGCGSAKLSSEESAKVARYEQAFATTVQDGEDFRATLDGVDYLIALCRAKRDAEYDQRSVKQVTEDAANTLREYQKDLAAQLDRVLDSDCA